jgi:molybdate transport system substrate-binding protein
MMELHLLSGGAAAGLVEPLQAGFESTHACQLKATFSAVGAMKEKLLGGDRCDLLILTQPMIEGLIASGHVRANTLRALGVVKTGVAVKQDSPRPAIGTRAELQAAFRAAEGIYFPDPKLATAGIHFFKVLQALGLEVELADRFHTYPNGATAMRAMAQASGARVIGSTQVTEIKYTSGIDLVGLLPHEFELATVYALGIPTQAQEPLLAQHLADLLTSETTRALRLSGGFELQD